MATKIEEQDIHQDELDSMGKGDESAKEYGIGAS